ncbi:MAG TPA: DUF4157 domain-containing protein [Gaiellaceae bacterium]|nr:DUF4157 domain-containing protein [Gaiellaceae bacterium]
MRVLARPAPLLQRRCVCGGTPGPDGECAACKAKRLQRSAAGAGPALAPPVVHDVLRSPGRPLEPGVRGEMEARLGHDFSQVRVHADDRAAASAQAVAAEAYTVGRHVVFGGGAYRPTSDEGRRLVAHELTHVVQQGGGDHGGARLAVAPARGALEAEAESALPGRTAAPSVQRTVVVKPAAAADQIKSHMFSFMGGGVSHSGGVLSIAGCNSVLAADEGNDCVCGAINDATRTYTINVAKSTAAKKPQKLFDGTTVPVPEASVFPTTTAPAKDPDLNFPDVGSDVEFGAFDPKGKPMWAPLWRVLGHELCGHGWRMQSYAGDTGDRSGHDSTIDTENAIAKLKGQPARGKYADPRQGESFFNVKGDPKVVFKLKDGLHYEVP